MKLSVNSFVVGAFASTLFAASAAQAVPLYEAAVLADNPTAYFRFNEASGAVSSETNAFVGASIGDPTLGTAGPVPPTFSGFMGSNTAAAFDGTDDSYTVAGLTAALDGASAISMEFWFNNAGSALDASFVATFVPVQTASGGTTTGANITIRNGAIRVGARSQGTDGFRAGANLTLSPEQLSGYTHVVGVIDFANGTIDTYLDGVLADSSSAVFGASVFTPLTPDGQSRIGGASDRFDAPQSSFVGGLDEVAIYDSALTASQVLAHYDAGVGVAVPEPASLSMLALGVGGLVARRRR